MVDRRIKAARFPAAKSLDTFDFLAIPSVNKHLVMQLARCEYVDRRENVIAVGNSGTGKTHVALGLGLAACQRGLSVAFTTAASLVHERRYNPPPSFYGVSDDVCHHHASSHYRGFRGTNEI